MASRMVYFDVETRSRADLKEVGMWKYLKDPSTTFMCMVWKVVEDGKPSRIIVWACQELPNWNDDYEVYHGPEVMPVILSLGKNSTARCGLALSTSAELTP